MCGHFELRLTHYLLGIPPYTISTTTTDSLTPPVYFFTNITVVIVVASTVSDDETFGLSWRVPLTALAVTTYIPWSDDEIGLFWPVNGVTFDSSVFPDIDFLRMTADDPFRKTCSEHGAPSFSHRQSII